MSPTEIKAPTELGQIQIHGASIDEIKAQRVPDRLGADIMKKMLAGVSVGIVVALVAVWLVRLF